jgi:predicted Kef-type K+ transport protein
MVRVLGLFLLVFALLSLVVHLIDMALLFVTAAVGALVADMVLSRSIGSSRQLKRWLGLKNDFIVRRML